ATLQCVSPRLASDWAEAIDGEEVERTIAEIAESAGHQWTPTTLRRSRGHLLSALKDFGVLAGRVRKQTVPRRITPGVTAFAVRLARLEGLSDRGVLGCLWFKLLGIDADGAIGALYAAHREGILFFREQAGAVEIR